MWPTDSELLNAWQKLVNDSNSAAEFASLVLPSLEAALRFRFPIVDPHFRTAAIEDALLAIIKNPNLYDPTIRPLNVFLQVIAKRKLLTYLRTEGRHQSHRIPWDSVELTAPVENEDVEGLTFDDPRLQSVIAEFTGPERAVLELLKLGERRTEVFAASLGLAEATVETQADEVKRIKDRIKARLKRAVEGDHA